MCYIKSITDVTKKNVKTLLKGKIEQYRKSPHLFYERINEKVDLALDIWILIAKIHDLKLKRVILKEGMVKYSAELPEVSESIEIDEGEIVEIEGNAEGWAVFVDFTDSTKYFIGDYITTEGNYTGFVIFNAFNMLLKSYLRYLRDYELHRKCCKFLEHTGDGAFLYFNINRADEFIFRVLFEILIISEILKFELLGRNCLDIDYNTSLIHIGASFGKGIMINWANEKKFISSATWRAARNCKEAPREFKPVNLLILIYEFYEMVNANFKRYIENFAYNIELYTDNTGILVSDINFAWKSFNDYEILHTENIILPIKLK